MYRDVMLAITRTALDDRALELAVEFCQTLDARLSVSVPFEIPIAAATAYGTSPVVMEASFAELREGASTEVTRIKARLHDRDLRFDVHLAEAQVYSGTSLLTLEARYHDMVIVAAPQHVEEQADAAIVHTIFASLVMDSGRPVLTVPRMARRPFSLDHIVIAWVPTPEATRAVHDAMPLLHQARRVDVLLSQPQVGERRHGQDPGADIGAHLARHGIPVNVTVRHSKRGSAGNDLLLSASEVDADLLIAGAYGHSRAREWAFGGVTRELLERADVPVLFSH